MDKDFLQLINGLVLTDFNVRPVLGILCPTNSLSCKGYFIPFLLFTQNFGEKLFLVMDNLLPFA